MNEHDVAEAAFLEQLERKRTEMMKTVRSKHARASTRKSPPVRSLTQRHEHLEQPSIAQQSLVLFDEDERDREQQELEVQWARSSALKVLQGGPLASNSAVLPPRKVEEGFGRLSALPVSPDPMFVQVSSHRIRKGTGRRAGLVLSCDGWGMKSDSLL